MVINHWTKSWEPIPPTSTTPPRSSLIDVASGFRKSVPLIIMFGSCRDWVLNELSSTLPFFLRVEKQVDGCVISSQRGWKQTGVTPFLACMKEFEAILCLWSFQELTWIDNVATGSWPSQTRISNSQIKYKNNHYTPSFILSLYFLKHTCTSLIIFTNVNQYVYHKI